MEKEFFVQRLIEVCGSSQPSRIAQLLNISYQAAKNYLDGRLPEAKVLKTIAERTPYSLNWLLTGTGDRFARVPETADDGELRDYVRKICVEVVGEAFESKAGSAEPKVFTLTADRIRDDKVFRPVSVSEVPQD